MAGSIRRHDGRRVRHPGLHRGIDRSALKVRLFSDAALRAQPPDDEPRGVSRGPKGRHHRFTTYDLLEARRAFKDAVRLDPAYASAHAGLAYTLIVLGNYGFIAPHTAREQAIAAIDRALALDPKLAQAHAARVYFLLLFEQQWHEAERLLTLALDLDPRDVEAHVFFAFLHVVQGQDEAAARQLAAARAIEPFSAWTRAVSGMAQLQMGDFNGAVREASLALEARPDSLLARTVSGAAMSCLGRHDEGIAAVERAVLAAPAHHWIRCTLGALYARAGRIADAERVLNDLAIEELASYVSPAWLALVPASLGRIEEALGLLELEIESGGAVPTFLRSPFLQALWTLSSIDAMRIRLSLPFAGR